MTKTAKKPGKRGRPTIPANEKAIPLSASVPAVLVAKLDALAVRKEWTRSQAVSEAIRRLVE